MYLVYLKYWTLNLMPLMVYRKVLFHPHFSIKALFLVGLDIFEEVLVNGEERRTARRLADQGALAALVASLLQHGL